MLLQSSVDNQIASYNVARDGGAVGFHPLGISIGTFSMMAYFQTAVTQTFTSAGGLATWTYGFRTLSLFPVVIVPVLAPVLASTLIAPSVVNLLATTGSYRNTEAIEFGIFIGVEPLTAGNQLFYTEYFNSDI